MSVSMGSFCARYYPDVCALVSAYPLSLRQSGRAHESVGVRRPCEHQPLGLKYSPTRSDVSTRKAAGVGRLRMDETYIKVKGKWRICIGSR